MASDELAVIPNMVQMRMSETSRWDGIYICAIFKAPLPPTHNLMRDATESEIMKIGLRYISHPEKGELTSQSCDCKATQTFMRAEILHTNLQTTRNNRGQYHISCHLRGARVPYILLIATDSDLIRRNDDRKCYGT
jgi:hypothetical protein